VTTAGHREDEGYGFALHGSAAKRGETRERAAGRGKEMSTVKLGFRPLLI